jgi:DNA-binding NarL/FixJ family response regulator
MIKILLAEIPEILSAGIISFLRSEPEILIIGRSESIKETKSILSKSETDIVVLFSDNNENLNLSGFICQLKSDYPHLKFLMLSQFENEENLIKMFEAGVNGLILKKYGKEDLLNSIQSIHEGGNYICSRMALGMLKKLQENKEFIFRNESRKIPILSKKEIEILQLIGEGFTNNEIADKTLTSRRTIEAYRKKLIEKTDTKNTATLIKYATYNQIIN